MPARRTSVVNDFITTLSVPVGATDLVLPLTHAQPDALTSPTYVVLDPEGANAEVVYCDGAFEPRTLRLATAAGRNLDGGSSGVHPAGTKVWVAPIAQHVRDLHDRIDTRGNVFLDGRAAFTDDQSMGGHRLTTVAAPVAADDAATKGYVDQAGAGVFVPKAGGTMTGPLLLPDGTVAEPTLAPSDDPTTGLYSAEQGSLDVASAGVRRLSVHGDGVTAHTAAGTVQQRAIASMGIASGELNELHLRAIAGKANYVTFTEDAIADRWAVGTEPNDANLWFSTFDQSQRTKRMGVDANGLHSTSLRAVADRVMYDGSNRNGTFTLDFAAAPVQSVTINGSSTINFSWPTQDPQRMFSGAVVLYSNAAAHPVVWGSGVIWSGGVVPSLSANARHYFVFNRVYNAGSYAIIGSGGVVA